MTRSKDHKYSFRLAMVLYARTNGIRAAAAAFGASRNTVRKWLRRFQEGGRSALQEQPRAPRRCPHKTSAYHERKILEARRQAPCFGPRRLKDLFDLRSSMGAIARVLRAQGLTRRRRKALQRKKRPARHQGSIQALGAHPGRYQAPFRHPPPTGRR